MSSQFQNRITDSISYATDRKKEHQEHQGLLADVSTPKSTQVYNLADVSTPKSTQDNLADVPRSTNVAGSEPETVSEDSASETASLLLDESGPSKTLSHPAIVSANSPNPASHSSPNPASRRSPNTTVDPVTDPVADPVIDPVADPDIDPVRRGGDSFIIEVRDEEHDQNLKTINSAAIRNSIPSAVYEVSDQEFNSSLIDGDKQLGRKSVTAAEMKKMKCFYSVVLIVAIILGMTAGLFAGLFIPNPWRQFNNISDEAGNNNFAVERLHGDHYSELLTPEGGSSSPEGGNGIAPNPTLWEQFPQWLGSSAYCSGASQCRIALVGNGPLTDEQRAAINQFETSHDEKGAPSHRSSLKGLSQRPGPKTQSHRSLKKTLSQRPGPKTHHPETSKRTQTPHVGYHIVARGNHAPTSRPGDRCDYLFAGDKSESSQEARYTTFPPCVTTEKAQQLFTSLRGVRVLRKRKLKEGTSSLNGERKDERLPGSHESEYEFKTSLEHCGPAAVILMNYSKHTRQNGLELARRTLKTVWETNFTNLSQTSTQQCAAIPAHGFTRLATMKHGRPTQRAANDVVREDSGLYAKGENSEGTTQQVYNANGEQLTDVPPSKARWGYSTGFDMLLFILMRHPGAGIHSYGFSWPNHIQGLDKHEPNERALFEKLLCGTDYNSHHANTKDANTKESANTKENHNANTKESRLSDADWFARNPQSLSDADWFAQNPQALSDADWFAQNPQAPNRKVCERFVIHPVANTKSYHGQGTLGKDDGGNRC